MDRETVRDPAGLRRRSGKVLPALVALVAVGGSACREISLDTEAPPKGADDDDDGRSRGDDDDDHDDDLVGDVDGGGIEPPVDGGPPPAACAACEDGERCLVHPAAEGASCVTECPTARRCGDDLCCPIGSRCGRGGVCGLANLSIDGDQIARSFEVEQRFFPAGSCAWEEGCVADFGDRTLLRFDLRTPNLGDADLFLGEPEQDPELFEFSSCHEHFHFVTYAAYELRTFDGSVAATGHKQAFCLIDIERVDPEAGAPQYDCDFQGISAGWADTYGSSLDCQWVDITGVPPGDYRLRVSVNAERVLAESDYDDNVVEVPVTIQ